MRNSKIFLSVAAAAALALTAAGCSSSDDATSAQSAPAPAQSGESKGGNITDKGKDVTAAFDSCDKVADLLTETVPGVLDDLELFVSDTGEGKATACDWQGEDGDAVAVEASPFEQTVPNDAKIDEAGGETLDSSKIADADGVLYEVGDSPRTVVGVVPYGRAVLQYSGVEIDDSAATTIVEELLGL